MKSFKQHSWAILPLLSILAMSPSVMESKYPTRSIASVTEDIKGHPKYESVVAKVDQELLIKDLDISLGRFKEKKDLLKEGLVKEREEFKKEQSEQDIVKAQREKIESLVIEVLLVEGSLRSLKEKELIEIADDELALKDIKDSKDIIEGLLADLEANEILVAKASEPKPEEPKVAQEDEVKKEEPKEELKKDEKSEQEKIICDLQDQNGLLTKQMDQLISDQKNIMQTILGMAQMMVGMYQQQSQQAPNPYYQNGPGFQQSPYQYHQPQTAGNWVYYPQGFQPAQPHIFAPPQQQGQGMYPDQVYQQQPQQTQPQWGLQPTINFQADPRFTPYQQFTPGPFGNDAFSFNMGNITPTVSQL